MRNGNKESVKKSRTESKRGRTSKGSSTTSRKETTPKASIDPRTKLDNFIKGKLHSTENISYRALIEEENHCKYEVLWKNCRAEGEGDSEKTARMNAAENML